MGGVDGCMGVGITVNEYPLFEKNMVFTNSVDFIGIIWEYIGPGSWHRFVHPLCLISLQPLIFSYYSFCYSGSY